MKTSLIICELLERAHQHQCPCNSSFLHMLTHLRNYTRLKNSRIYENRREKPPFSYTFCNHQLFLLESFYTSSVNKVEDEMAKNNSENQYNE